MKALMFKGKPPPGSGYERFGGDEKTMDRISLKQKRLHHEGTKSTKERQK